MSSFDDVYLEVSIVPERKRGIQVGKELLVFKVDTDLIQPIFGELLLYKIHQRQPAVGVDEVPALYGFAELLCVVKSDLLAVEMKPVSQRLGVVQYFLYRRLKPAFDVPAYEVAGEEEEKQCGDKREGGEEEKEFCFEVSADDFSFSLEVEFYQVSAQDEEKDEEEKDDDELKGGEKDVGEGCRGELL